MKRSKRLLALVLAVSLCGIGCTDQWIKVALADLPVLVQMALNIGTIISTLQSGKQISAADAAAVQNISAQASKDLNLLDQLYQDYKANPSADALQKIQNVITDIDENLPALLVAAHISDAVLSARLSAAVNLILTTVASFASLMPQAPATQQRRARQGIPGTAKQKIRVPNPNDLKRQWNQQVAPQFKVGGGFWSGFGSAFGEAKWGGS